MLTLFLLNARRRTRSPGSPSSISIKLFLDPANKTTRSSRRDRLYCFLERRLRPTFNQLNALLIKFIFTEPPGAVVCVHSAYALYNSRQPRQPSIARCSDVQLPMPRGFRQGTASNVNCRTRPDRIVSFRTDFRVETPLAVGTRNTGAASGKGRFALPALAFPVVPYPQTRTILSTFRSRRRLEDGCEVVKYVFRIGFFRPETRRATIQCAQPTVARPRTVNGKGSVETIEIRRRKRSERKGLAESVTDVPGPESDA